MVILLVFSLIANAQNQFFTNRVALTNGWVFTIDDDFSAQSSGTFVTNDLTTRELLWSIHNKADKFDPTAHIYIQKEGLPVEIRVFAAEDGSPKAIRRIKELSPPYPRIILPKESRQKLKFLSVRARTLYINNLGNIQDLFASPSDEIYDVECRLRYPKARVEVFDDFIGGILSSDDLEPREQKLSALSETLATDIIWVTFQTTAGSFAYHDWQNGAHLRALTYGCEKEGRWLRVERMLGEC